MLNNIYSVLLVLSGIILFLNPNIIINRDLYLLDGDAAPIVYILIAIFSLFLVLKGIDRLLEKN
ncbi:hypothetical protein [Corticicoccus populi]|uniref:DUF3955 domain-containing protein n=1 Tax=Corticicoccus populi TaxID=1812821 RepID=A0ABW5WZY1_9STAP